MEFLANLLANASEAAANTGSKACMIWVLDEPECPESLIK
ncbi:MAG: cyclic lactone autoinducer peptide [Bacilli bacterium]|nr:cyclic lactone autoinducer peptide [Bacilli bacterium]